MRLGSEQEKAAIFIVVEAYSVSNNLNIPNKEITNKIIQNDRCVDSDCLHEQSKKSVSLLGEHQKIHHSVV